VSEIALWYDIIENGRIKNNFHHGEYAIEKFFNKHISIPNLLCKNEIDFTIGTTSYGAEYLYKKYKNLKNFYPIEMGSYYGNARTDQLPINDKWFFKKVNTDVEILIWYPTEGFTINRKSESLNGLFELIHTKYPLNKIRFVFGDFYKSANIPDYVNYKSFKNFFWYDTITNIPKPVLNPNKRSQYDFITLNRKYRVSRYMVFTDLKRSGMLKNAFYTNLCYSNISPISMVDAFKTFYKTDNDNSFFARIHTDEFIKELHEITATVSNPKPDADIKLQDLDLSETSYLELVNETNFDSTQNLFITEKTYRAIATGHIFLICGQPKTLKHLKRNGFQTFDDLFDESYDNIPSFAERWVIIKKNLELWISMSDSEKQNYYKKSFDKIVHNQKLLYDRNFKSEIQALFED
jgi:hypothetical protein